MVMDRFDPLRETRPVDQARAESDAYLKKEVAKVVKTINAEMTQQIHRGNDECCMSYTGSYSVPSVPVIQATVAHYKANGYTVNYKVVGEPYIHISWKKEKANASAL